MCPLIRGGFLVPKIQPKGSLKDKALCLCPLCEYSVSGHSFDSSGFSLSSPIKTVC